MPLSSVPQWAKPLRPMEGVARKLVLLFIALSAVGWIVFLAGFIKLIKDYQEDNDDYDPSDDTSQYYAWAASVLGPALFLLATLHATLWRWPSSADGSVTALIGVGYVSAIGFGLNAAGDDIRTGDDNTIERVVSNVVFAGGFLSCLFWALVQAMWLWYPVTSLQNVTKIRPLTGISRKVVLPFIALSAVGWGVFVAGLVKFLQFVEINAADSGEDYYWAWAACVSGLVVHILAVVHAVLWGIPSLIVGSLTAVLGVFYIIAIGVGLRVFGYLINLINDNHPYVISLNDGLTSYRLLFAGSFLTSLFWAVVQAMWPWYATGMETEEELTEDRKKLREWISFKPYRPLEGIARKVVLIFIGLSVVGWIVFVVGFGLHIKWNYDQPEGTVVIHDVFNVYYYNDDFSLGNAPYLYWGWVVSIGGPVVYLLAVAHAVMWTRISSILGSVTAILGTAFISAAAYRLIQSGIVIYYDIKRENPFPLSDFGLSDKLEDQDNDKILCAGGLCLCLFWAVVQALWPWYSYSSVTAIKTSCSKVTHPRILEGAARKIMLLLLALSVIGWVLFVIGFHELTKGYKDNDTGDEFGLGDSAFLYWAWAAIAAGPVVYILAVVHAVLWGLPSAIFGSLTAIAGMVYITGIGCGLITSGITLDHYTDLEDLGDYEKSWKLTLAGSLVATFFWALVQAMWPWYSTGLNDVREPSANNAHNEEVQLKPM